MAKSYPMSKFKRKQRDFGDEERPSYRGGDYNRGGDRFGGGGRGGGRGRGRGGRGGGEDGVKRSNTYGYEKRSKYNDDYYDYDDEDYYEEEESSYKRPRDKDAGSGYNKKPADRQDYRGDSRGGGRGGGSYNNRGGDSWRDNRGYYDRNQGDRGSKPGYDRNRGPANNDENSQAENEERVVYVSNLNYDTNDQGLRKAFRDYGTIERVNIGYRRDGKSLGNAQVQFRTKRDAMDAVEQMDGQDIDGRPIKIKIFKSWEAYRKEKEAQSPDQKRDYVKNDRGGDGDY